MVYLFNMPRINFESPSEELLIEEGLINRRSVQRRAIIGCTGCRWLKAEQQGQEPSFYGYELMKCTRIKGGTIYPILHRLANVGVIIAEQEDINAHIEGRPPRALYYPADSELGIAFYERLEIPEICPLETDVR